MAFDQQGQHLAFELIGVIGSRRRRIEALLNGLAATLGPLIEGLAGDSEATADLRDGAIAASGDHLADRIDSLLEGGMNVEQYCPPAGELAVGTSPYPAGSVN